MELKNFIINNEKVTLEEFKESARKQFEEILEDAVERQESFAMDGNYYEVGNWMPSDVEIDFVMALLNLIKHPEDISIERGEMGRLYMKYDEDTFDVLIPLNVYEFDFIKAGESINLVDLKELIDEFLYNQHLCEDGDCEDCTVRCGCEAHGF